MKSPEGLKRVTSNTERVAAGRFSSAATLLSLSSVVIRTLGLVTTSILARVLTPADYGVVALALTATGFFEVLTNLQITGSLIRSPEIGDDQFRSAFTLNAIRGLLSFLIIFIFAHLFATVLGDQRLTPVLQTLALGPLIIGFQNPAFVIFERNLHFRPEVIRAIIAAAGGTVASICVALLARSYWALVISALTSALLQTLMSYWRSPIRVGFSTAHIRAMFDFGGWLVLVSIIEYFNSKVDVLLIGRGLGARLLGAYQGGGQVIATATGDVVGPLVRAIFPSLAMAKSVDELRLKYIRIQAVILALALPIGIGLSAIAPQVVQLLLGSQWHDAIPVIQLLGPLSAVQTVLATVDAVAMSTGQTKQLFRRTTTVFAVRVALLLLGYYLDGFMGILFARVLSGTFYLIYGLRLAAKLTGTRALAPVYRSWRSIASVFFMYACVRQVALLVPGLNFPNAQLAALLIGYIILGGAVYLISHAVLWVCAGSPEGVESRILEHVRQMFEKYRPRD